MKLQFKYLLLMTKKYLSTLLAIVFWLVLGLATILFLIPSKDLSIDVLDWSDKAQHIVAFATLMVLGMAAYPQAISRMFAGLLIYGAAIECIQSMTGWRSGDFLDWVADATGVLLIRMLLIVWRRYFLERNSLHSNHLNR